MCRYIMRAIAVITKALVYLTINVSSDVKFAGVVYNKCTRSLNAEKLTPQDPSRFPEPEGSCMLSLCVFTTGEWH